MKNKTFERILRLLAAGICMVGAACLIALATLLLIGVKPDLLTSPPKAEEEQENSEKLELTPDYGQFYIDSIIFAGDKSIAGMIEAKVLSGGNETLQVWAGENGDLALDSKIAHTSIIYPETGDAMSISRAAAEKKPQYLVLTLGLSNGVAYCSEEAFRSYYGELLDSITAQAPEAKIMLQSVFPVSKAFEKKNAGITAKKIKDANKWIRELAAEKGVRYLDTFEALCDKDGHLKDEYDSGDGVILNSAGYQRVLEYIRTHGYK